MSASAVPGRTAYAAQIGPAATAMSIGTTNGKKNLTGDRIERNELHKAIHRMADSAALVPIGMKPPLGNVPSRAPAIRTRKPATTAPSRPGSTRTKVESCSERMH